MAKNIECWKGRQKKKKRQEKMTNRECFWKKSFGEKKRAKHLSNCRKPFFCIRDDNTSLKNPWIAGNTALVVIVSKQTTDTNKKKVNQPKKQKKKATQQQSRQQQQKSKEAPNARKLGLERECDGNRLKGKQQNWREVEGRRKRIGQNQQN